MAKFIGFGTEKIDAMCGSQPHIALLVFRYSVYTICGNGGSAIICFVSCKATGSMVKDGQSSILCSYPQPSVVIFMKREYGIAAQTGFGI